MIHRTNIYCDAVILLSYSQIRWGDAMLIYYVTQIYHKKNIIYPLVLKLILSLYAHQTQS